MNVVRRGEIYYVDLGEVLGSEQGGVRPCMIVQNDIGNRYSPTTVIAPITSQYKRVKLPTHAHIGNANGILPKVSIVLCEQVKVIDKSRLQNYVGMVDSSVISIVNNALKISLSV